MPRNFSLMEVAFDEISPPKPRLFPHILHRKQKGGAAVLKPQIHVVERHSSSRRFSCVLFSSLSQSPFNPSSPNPLHFSFGIAGVFLAYEL